jgi:hypothetical protein
MNEIKPKSSGEVAAVINDVHIPFEDQRSINLFIKWLDDNKLDRLFLNGDIMDMPDLSKFDKDPNNRMPIEEQIERTKGFLKLLIQHTRAKIYYVSGNHEKRLKKYLMRNAPELCGVVNLKELLDLDKLGVELIDPDPESYLKYGSTLIGHFDMARKGSAMTARGLLQRFGGAMSVVQAHTHRGGVVYQTLAGRTVASVENFCMCDPNPNYITLPDWQNGFTKIVSHARSAVQEIIQFHIGEEGFTDGEKKYK